MKKLWALIVGFVFLLCIFTGCAPTSNSPKGGKDYEGVVWEAFWETTSSSLGLEYSDYKMAHTAYSFITESKTSDGYTAYYYLIQTAYETENVFGKKVLHPITARCYYVPEYSNDVYTTYMTVDGETVLFDEETEAWLLDIGGSSATQKSETQENTSTSEEKVEKEVGTKAEKTVFEENIEISENNIGIEQSNEREHNDSDMIESDDYSAEEYYEEDEFDYSNDDLEYKRKIAEMEWMNEFDSEEIIIEEYEEPERDLDGIVTNLSPEVYEALQRNAMNE